MKKMDRLRESQIIVHRLIIQPFQEHGMQFDCDIEATHPTGWHWRWVSIRRNASRQSMPELRIQPNIQGLVSMLIREGQEQAQARNQDEYDPMVTAA